MFASFSQAGRNLLEEFFSSASCGFTPAAAGMGLRLHIDYTKQHMTL